MLPLNVFLAEYVLLLKEDRDALIENAPLEYLCVSVCLIRVVVQSCVYKCTDVYFLIIQTSLFT